MAAAPDDDARRTLAELEAKLRELERELLRGHEPEAPPAAPEPAAAAEPEPAPEPDYTASPAEPEHAAPPAEPALEPEPAAPLAEPAFEPEPTALPGEPAPAFPFDAHPDPAPLEAGVPPTDGGGGWIVPGIPAAPEPEPEPVLDLDALHDAHELLDGLRKTIDDLGLTAERITTEAHAVIDDHGRTLGRLERAAEAATRAEQAAVEAGRLAATVVVEAGPFANAAAVGALRDALAAQPNARDAYVRGVEDGRAVIEVHLAPPPA